MTIRVFLVDDHKMFREGLRTILERDEKLTVVGETNNGRDAVKMTLELVPNVVIMDIGMPELNGVEAARQIHSHDPEIKLIALSTHSDRRFVASMLEAGASAYVIKEASGEELLRAIHAVHLGRKYLSPEIAGSVVEGFLSDHAFAAASEPRRKLEAREREVVQLLTEGKTAKDVAKALHISVLTAETHRRNIMRKLEIHSLSSLTKYAIREGITSAEG